MRVLPLLFVMLVLAACSSPSAAETGFTMVELPPGAVPQQLAVMGDDLLVGVYRDAKPGLIRYHDGTSTEVPLTPKTGYGAEALWYSLATNGDEILAVGGKSGGAHGNVRWSVWRGTTAGIVEQPQAFSAFGGYGAGDLTDGVFPSAGPLLVGSWQSASAGSDAAVWTTDGTVWTRQSSAGTSLESTRAALKFPMAAASHGAEVVLVGWQLVKGRQQPVAWTLTNGTATLTALSDAGRIGVATSVTCTDTCAIAGRVDGRLAVWRGVGNTWRRVSDVPDVPVGDEDRPSAPLGDTLVYTDRGNIHIGTLGADMRIAHGPTGVVTAVARVDDTTYVLAGPEDNKQILWRAD